MSDPALPHDAIAERLSSLVADTDIPLEQQTPWQRYEMASFGDNRPTAVARAAAEKSARAALQKQLSEQIANSRQQARDEGHAEGHADGFAAGHAEGLAQGRLDAAAEREQLLQLLVSFTDELARANETVSREVMSLALDVAKAMLKTALPAKPELVLPVIEDAMLRLPTLQPPALIVRGDETDTFFASTAQRVKRVNPRVNVETIAAATHLVPLERPGEVHQHITAFLNAL